MDAEESGGETGLGDPALRILYEDVAGAAVGGPTGQEGLWYAGSRGNRQEMFVIRGFPSLKLPLFPDPAAGKGHRELWTWRRQEPAFGTAAGRAVFAGAPGARRQAALGDMTLGTQPGLPSFGIGKFNQTS